MEYQSQKIIKIIEQILPLMADSDSPLVNHYHDFLVYSLDQLNKPHDLFEVAANIRRSFWGMGTLNDVVLSREGIPLNEMHKKFSDLREELYLACLDAIALQDKQK